MEEGKIVKGGVGERPTSKRPDPPKGQGVNGSDVKLYIGGKLIKGMSVNGFSINTKGIKE